MTPYRLGIIGSRNYPRLEAVDELILRLDDYSRRSGREIVIVSGTEPRPMDGRSTKCVDGVDEAAIRYARAIGFATEVIPVTREEWDTLGKKAGPLRNTKLVDAVDGLAAFWDLRSRGTADAVTKGLKRGLRVEVYGPDGTKLQPDYITKALQRIINPRFTHAINE